MQSDKSKADQKDRPKRQPMRRESNNENKTWNETQGKTRDSDRATEAQLSSSPSASCGCSCIVRAVLPLPALELGLFQQTSLLRQASAFLAIFDLVLAYKGMRWLTEDA